VQKLQLYICVSQSYARNTIGSIFSGNGVDPKRNLTCFVVTRVVIFSHFTPAALLAIIQASPTRYRAALANGEVMCVGVYK